MEEIYFICLINFLIKKRGEKQLQILKTLKKYLKNLKNKFPLILMERLYDPVFDLDLLGNKGRYVFHVLRRRVDSEILIVVI